MYTHTTVLCVCLLIVTAIKTSYSFREGLNFVIKPLEKVCFYEDFEKNSQVKTIEIFVENGSNSQLDLSIYGPLELSDIYSNHYKNLVLTESIDTIKEVSSDALTFVLDFKPKYVGTYGICLDNHKSRFVSKRVQLDVRPALSPVPIAISTDTEGNNSTPKDEFAIVKESIDRIRKGLSAIQDQQQWNRHRLAIHSDINISSHNWVVTGSIIETIIFLLVSLFQIFFVRHWFTHKIGSQKHMRA